jgi:hypothetical protein
MNKFDKFAWLDAIRDDDDLAPGVKYVLQNIALVYLRHNGDAEFYARQDTVAEELQVSVRLVKTAYREARDRRYFVLATAKRSRGRGKYDRYVLQLPANTKGVDSAPFDGVKGARNGDKRGTKCAEKGHEVSIKGARQNAVTSEKQEEAVKEKQVLSRKREAGGGAASRALVPVSEHTLTTQSLERATAPPPPSPPYLPSAEEPALGGITPPSRYCRKHQPFGPDDDVNCHGCGRARINRDRTWPTTDDGLAYLRMQTTAKELAISDGKADRRLAKTAMLHGQTLEETRERQRDLFNSKPPSAAQGREQA